MLFAGKWMELENFMLNKDSQAQKIKGSMFSLLCRSKTYKLNVYISIYLSLFIYLYLYICIYMSIYIYFLSLHVSIYWHFMSLYIERTKLYGWVCLSRLWEEDERKKMLENEKFWNNSSLYEYNKMHCTVNCWI
jgi:hypothetical protein